MTPICFVDTETDGVNPWRQPWEIAVIRRDDEGEHRLHVYVEIDLSTADPFGLRIGRFHERHPLGRYLSALPDMTPTHPESRLNLVSRRPSPDMDVIRPDIPAPWYVSKGTAANLVAKFTHGAHLVGAVPNFDAEVLDKLLRDTSLMPAWHYHLIDVENVARGWLLGQGATLNWVATKSDDLSRQCGVEPPSEDERHTAMGDAEWCMRWWDRLTTTAPQEA